MEKEISSGTMLGIVLIALAAVIGLGFGVFSIAKGVANEGTVGVQDNLNTVTDSAFEDYNDKVVTGTQVKSAIQNFEGKSVAILINTTAMNKGVKSYANRTTKDITDGTGVTVTTGGCTVVKINDLAYVNYNALLSKGTDGAVIPTIGGGDEGGVPVASEAGVPVTEAVQLVNSDDPAKLKDGVLTVSHAFALDEDGKVLFDYSIGGQSRTGNWEYVSTSSKFESNIIKDTSGTNIGIMFTQMAK